MKYIQVYPTITCRLVKRSEEGSEPQGGGFFTELVASEKLVQWLHIPRHPDSCWSKGKVEIKDPLPSQRLRKRAQKGSFLGL